MSDENNDENNVQNNQNVNSNQNNSNQNIPNQNTTTQAPKKNIGSKLLITGILGGTVLYNATRSFLFGSPPKPWRKVLFYGSLATMFAYNSCSQEIDGAFSSAQQKADQWWNNTNYEGKLLAEKEVEKLKNDKLNLRNSLNNQKKRVHDLEGKLADGNVVQEKINTLDNKFEKYINKPNVRKQTTKPTYTAKTPGKSTITKTSSEAYWYVVKKGDMLGNISKHVTGDLYKFKEIAAFNGISNPSDVPVGYPLQIPKDIIRNYSGLRSDGVPSEFHVLKRGESVGSMVKRLYGTSDPERVSNILQYNRDKGNVVPKHGFNGINQAIIYVK